MRFPSVDAALKFAEWFEGEDGTPPAPLYDRGGAEAGGVLPSAEEVALRDGLVEVLRGAGIEVVTDEAEGQRVLDAANRAADVLDEMKKRNQQQETALPEDESSFKGTAISSADGAKIIKNLESGKKASNQIPQRPNGDTPESARSNDSDAILPAKLQKVADNASVEEEKSSEALFEATKEKFGTTNDLREAGYILPDGTMLDFSGRYMVDKGRDTSHLRGRRAVDHRAIHEVGYDQDDNETGFITDMADFIGRGAIRIDANAGTINLSKVPTAKQARVLRMLILRNDGDVSVDFGNGYDSEHYAEYESARATRVLGDIDRYFNEGIKPQGNISFFRTENGEAYGFVRDGKIYIDPRVASAETPVHEYCHLWADALKRANPEAWERLKETMLGEKDVLEHVKRLYPELEGDELLGEVFSHYSGKRGAERLRADMEHEVKNAEGVFAKARVAVVFDKIRRALSRFWQMARDLFAGKNSMLNGMRAEDFADMAMNDMLRGFDPRGEEYEPQARNTGRDIALDDRVSQREYLLSDNYVARLTGNEFAKSDTPLTERVAQFYTEKYGGKVEREGFGMVHLDKRGVKDSLSHGLGRNKAAAFAAVPSIIKDGALIDHKENFKGRNQDSYTLAAPVEIGDKGYVGVVIVTRGKGTDRNKFYLHEVILQKNLLSEEFKTGMVTGSKQGENLHEESIKTDTKADSHQGDVAKILKEIVTAKESGEKVANEDAVPYGETTISQGFGSAGTSLNQVPSATRKINWEPGTVNVDIGGGRFDKATDYLRERGVENLVFDPFNRAAEHNKAVAERVRDEKVDTVTCNNVLNVIDSEASRANVILQAAKALKKGGTAYFSVYEGDKSGVGRQTKSDSWQNNRPTKDYIPEIEQYFDDVTLKNSVITARNPKPTDELSVWDFDGEYNGNGIAFERGEGYGEQKNSSNVFAFGENELSLQSELDIEAVDTQRANMPKTAPWREGVDEVVIQTTLPAIKKKYSELHAKAKAGDVEAAEELISNVVKPEKVKALVEQHPNAIVAFVHALENSGRNQLPAQYAQEFEMHGLELSAIIQTNRPSHTDSDKVGRFVRRSRFDGKVEPGREYIIVDDHVTMGSTLRDLKDYIESKGGKVVAVSTLTASAGGTKLRPTEEQIKELNNKGVTNEQLKELGIADGFEGLTRSEAREVLVLANSRGNQGTSRRRTTLVGNRSRVEEEASGSQSEVSDTGSTYYSKGGDVIRFESYAEQLNLFGTPHSGALRQHDISGKPTTRNERVKRASEMSDAELLKEMQRDIAEFEKLGRGDWGIQTACTDEYDRRHIKEYNAECERVRTMLDENNVSIEEAEDMLCNAIYSWRDGYATADRSKLLAQFDTLNDYYAEKTDERDNADLYQEVESEQAISEADARNTETPTQQEVAPTTQQTEPAKPKKAAFDPSAIKLRKLKSGETCHVERRYQESGGFDFTGSEKVESDADLAYIFRNLENSAIENTFLVLIKNGKATILHVGMGGYAFSAGHLGAGVLAASQLKPDSVIFVHNHPSGTLQPSQQDIAMQEKVKKMFGADKVREAIIIDITSGKYSVFDSDGWGAKEKQRPTSAENEVPYKTYSFSQQVFAEGFVPGSTFQITDSDKAAEFISGHRLGERDKLSLIVLNRQKRVTGNIFLPWTSLDGVDVNKAAGVIAKFIHQMGGESGILYGSGTISRGTLTPLARAISNYEVHLDDFISVEGKSAYQYGAMEPEVEYEAVPRNTGQQPTEVAEDGVGYGEADDSGISDEELAGYDAGRYSFAESITQGLVDLALKNTHDQQLRLNAMREFDGNLAKLRKIMNKQKAYDKGTVDDIVRLARMVMGSGFFKDMSAYEVKRLLAAIKKGVGAEDLTPIANNVVDMLVQHQLRESKNMLHKLMQVRGRKVDARGVEVQAGLDIDGQRMMSALKDGMSLSEDGLSTRINDCENRLGSEDEVIRKNAMSEYQGLMLAKQWHDNILSGEEEEIALRNEKRQEQEKIYDFRREPVLDDDGNAIINQDGSVRTVERKTLKPQFKNNVTDENKQLRRNTEAAIERIEQSIRESRMERVTSYIDFMSDVAGDVRASRERAAEWRAEQQERIDEIHHNANSDLEGVPVQSQVELPEGGLLAFNSNNDIVRLLFQPLATFEKMLRFFGRKAHNGEGYLFNRFMRGWVDCNDKEWRSKRAAHEELDAKVNELFGKKAKRWSDLYKVERNKKHPGIPVEYWDNGERKRKTMSQGEALSLVVWSKQKDAEAGLRRMGISEEDIETIKSLLDPKFLELAEWVVEEFLPKRREYYNEVHERMFGAPMAAIEHYFPIVRNKRDLPDTSDITERDRGDTKPSTITGNIIKRKRTSATLNLQTDFFDHLLKHLDDMENWAAWAEFNRDINTLRHYMRFKNRVLNMRSLEFGAGEELWKAFDDACAIVAGSYHPSTKRGSGDNLAVNIAKGVTGAKIAFRFYTAAKQLLSLPAFWNGDASLLELAKWVNPVGAIIAWNWAMKNLPGFSKRWQSRQVGDVRLMDTDSDYAFWRNNMVRALSRGGMWANALVDGMTVAMGARAVYETKKKRYLRNGYSEEQAEKRAMQDATINYNSSQQSSEDAFLSSLQLDRTWWSTLMTVFRSASMGYQRRLTTGLRNLKNRMKKGYKAESIEFMKKQMVRDGIDEATAEKAARRTYRWGGIRSMADVFVFGLVLPFFWNLGPYALYLLMGDDDDEKKDMLKDAAVHSLFGPVEGLTGGQAMSEIGNTWAGYLMSDNDKSLLNALRYHDYLSMPLGSDLQQIFNEAGTDSMAAWTDAFNLLVQAGIGVNPETFTDAWVAIADACDGDPQTTKEFALCFMRVMQVPQTQIDKLFIDELGMTARDAQKLNAMEMADRYARYKKFRNAPLLNWAYSPDESQKVAEKYRKRFLDNMQERMERLDDEQLGWNFENPNDSERRKAVGKVYAKGKGVQDSAGKKPASNWKPETRRSQLKYQRLRDYNDLAEDVLLDVAIDQAKNRGDGETEKALRDAKKELTEIKRGKHTKTIDINGLGDGSADDDKAIMEELRARRKEILREHGVR